MPVSKKRKKTPTSSTVQSRQKRQLYLPLAQVDADQLCLQARLSFEALRTGRGDRAAALNMSAIAMMCETLTADGHGLLPLSMLRQVRESTFDALDKGSESGNWHFSEQLIDELTTLINEYDRQMREIRLQAIIVASEKVDHFLVKRAQARLASADTQSHD